MRLKINWSLELLALNEMLNLSKLSYNRSIFLVFLNFRIFKMLNKIGQSLQTSISQTTNLYRR